MKNTPLHSVHVDAGARMVEFGGWSMPVQYGSILDEVTAVRQRSGLFDLSHMGRFLVEGPDAVALVDRVATNYCGKIPNRSIRYSLFCRENGYPIDDLLLYRDEEDVFVVVNASNADEDLAWMREHGQGLDAKVVDQTEELAMVALQGPKSTEILAKVTTDCETSTGELAKLGYYKFTFATVCGMKSVRVSRTGYTGENGFEIYFPAAEAPRVWNELLEAGKDEGLIPIGLGARDTLRLEAGMPLYGHEIDATHNPLEAGLDFGISFDEEKGDYIGRSALQSFAQNRKRRLVGITTDGKRVPRQGYTLVHGDRTVGEVCSGSVSPTVGTNIGSAFVEIGLDSEGTELEMDVRGKRQPVRVQDLPFYSRTRK